MVLQLQTHMKTFAGSARHDATAAWFGRWPMCSRESVHPAISVATTDRDLHDIGLLRYELYVDRDGKKYDHVAHTERTFLEPVDVVSLNFQARLEGRLLASVRLVRADDALLDPHLRLLVEAYRPDCLETTAVCSRFAVRPEHRARALIKPLFIEVYRAGFSAGARHWLLGTRSSLVGMFERFGFRCTESQLFDPVAGRIHVLALDTSDLAHMRDVVSPLLSHAEFDANALKQEIGL